MDMKHRDQELAAPSNAWASWCSLKMLRRPFTHWSTCLKRKDSMANNRTATMAWSILSSLATSSLLKVGMGPLLMAATAATADSKALG